jgi:hypothetical protein
MTIETEDRKAATQLAFVIAAMAVLMNVGFYFLADVYYAEKKAGQGLLSSINASTVQSTRLSFALFTGLVSASMIAAMFRPRIVAHVLASVFGTASLVAAIAAVRAGMPGALSMALLVLGFAFPALTWRSVAGSRAAWSFLAAICWVLGVTMLFGAPKVRAKMDVGLWTAMIIPGLLFVAGVALTAIRGDYRDGRR